MYNAVPYLLIDDGFGEHPKIVALTDKAFRLHLTALVWCARNLTDGLISPLGMRISSANASLERPNRVVQQLVSSGLWEPNGDGWRIHHYLEYNPSRAELQDKRKQARERQRRYRQPGNASPSRVTPRVTNAWQDPPSSTLKGTTTAEPLRGSTVDPHTSDTDIHERTPPTPEFAALAGRDARREAIAQAHELALVWTTPNSLAFDETLDRLQTGYGVRFSTLERDRLWDTAHKASAGTSIHTTPPEEPTT